ncbi:unnamed protein product, partial [Prorocentrum cordatum]
PPRSRASAPDREGRATAPACPAMAMLQPQRRARRAALGAALCGVATICHQSVGFLAAPSKALGLTSPGANNMVGREVPEACREASPVVMHAGGTRGGTWSHPEKTFDRTRQSGSGRKSMSINRKACLAYATAGQTGRPEPGAAVLRRMWDMYDQDRASLRQRYHWGSSDQSRYRIFTANYYMRVGRKKNEQRLRRNADTTWANYMATTGKKLGLQEPIIYNGPSVSPARLRTNSLRKNTSTSTSPRRWN